MLEVLQFWILMNIVGESFLPIPRPFQSTQIFKHNLALVAHKLELYQYPTCTNLNEARHCFRHVIQDRRRKLVEIENFFFLDLPESHTNLHMVAMNDKIRSFITVCRRNAELTAGDVKQAWLSIAEEAKTIYNIYDLIDDLHRDIPYYCKRNKLAVLYELLGEEAFKAGQIPPPIPWWRIEK